MLEIRTKRRSAARAPQVFSWSARLPFDHVGDLEIGALIAVARFEHRHRADVADPQTRSSGRSDRRSGPTCRRSGGARSRGTVIPASAARVKAHRLPGITSHSSFARSGTWRSRPDCPGRGRGSSAALRRESSRRAGGLPARARRPRLSPAARRRSAVAAAREDSGTPSASVARYSPLPGSRKRSAPWRMIVPRSEQVVDLTNAALRSDPPPRRAFALRV